MVSKLCFLAPGRETQGRWMYTDILFIYARKVLLIVADRGELLACCNDGGTVKVFPLICFRDRWSQIWGGAGDTRSSGRVEESSQVVCFASHDMVVK